MAHHQNRAHTTSTHSVPGLRRLLILAAAVACLSAGCSDDGAAPPPDDPLFDLQVVGIDFPLNSILLTNVGTDPVRTQGLHLCQDGECMEFNIFTIAPRATILFSVSRVGGVDPAGGELALHRSDAFEDPESVVDYVAWGVPGHQGVQAAAAAQLWNEDDYVPTEGGTIILTRVEPTIGSDTWQASAEIP